MAIKSNLIQAGALPKPKEIEEARKGFQEILNNLGLEPSPRELTAYTYYALGKSEADKQSQKDKLELYNAASECYEAARKLCDCLAFEIFL